MPLPPGGPRPWTGVSRHTCACQGRFGGGAGGGNDRITSSLAILDPSSGEIKKRGELPYPNSSGVLATAGDIVVTALLDGSIIAFDDQTLEVLWRVNVGSGFKRAARDLFG